MAFLVSSNFKEISIIMEICQPVQLQHLKIEASRFQKTVLKNFFLALNALWHVGCVWLIFLFLQNFYLLNLLISCVRAIVMNYFPFDVKIVYSNLYRQVSNIRRTLVGN